MNPIDSAFKSAFDSLRSRWKPLLGLMAIELVGRYLLIIAMTLATIAAVIGTAWSVARLNELPQLLRDPQVLAAHLLPMLAVSLGGLAALALFETWVLSALFYAAENRSASLGQWLAGGWSNLAGFGWVLTLTTLVIAAGFLCLVIPGVFLTLLFLLAPQAYFVEGKRGWAALACARQRVSGRLLPLSLRLLALFAGLSVGAAALHSLKIPFFLDVYGLLALPFAVLFQSTLYRDLLARSAAPSPAAAPAP